MLSISNLKIAILQEVAQQRKSLNKLSLLGGRRPGQRGALEHRLAITFDNAQRALAAQTFEEMKRTGLVRADYTQPIDPEDWVEITDAGQRALQTGLVGVVQQLGISKFGIPDHSSFQTKLPEMVGNDKTVSVLFLDLDNFKSVNDNHNHSVGDQVIREVIDVVQGAIEGKGELFHRSGDEMLVLLPNFDDGEAASVGERIRRGIAVKTFSVIGAGVVTATIGISTYPESCCEWERLEEVADEAAMKSKKTGKNRVAHTATSDASSLAGLGFIHGVTRRDGPL